jgi:tRNA nucleotidyltransferase (CCA-adding enzyme)
LSLKLPNDDKKFYQSLLELADGKDLHIVGGYVRDLLLGTPTVDLDFMIDRNLKEFLDSVVHKISESGVAVSASYSRFSTAKLSFSKPYFGHSIVDFSQARKETYPTLASRPEVTEGLVKEDILRRDFTINSIAILRDDFLDLTSGRKDLEEKLIRIHHNNSFRDDPIRLVRAVRFKNRLNFKLEENTSKHFDITVNENSLALVSPRRRFEELRKVHSEKKRSTILQELQSRGVLKALCPAVLETIPNLEDDTDFESSLLSMVRRDSPDWVSYVKSLGLPKAESKRLLS